MWINKTGQVDDTLTILGTTSNPVYLLKGDSEYSLVEGGLTRDAETLLSQLKEHIPDLSLVKHWFITHSHYDHCGAVEFLYPYLKDIKIYASENAVKNFRNEKYVKKIRQLNSSISGKEIIQEGSLSDIQFEIVHDKQILKNNSGTWKIMYTPGHSNCSMSIINEEKDIIFVSDALGEIINTKNWFPLAFDNVVQFIDSINKIGSLQIKTIALGHNGILTGSEAFSASVESLRGCNEVIEFIATRKDYLSLDELVDELYKKYDVVDHSFIPENVYRKSIEILISLLKTESFV